MPPQQSIKDSQIAEMQDRVKPHLEATAEWGELEAHRNIVLSRLETLRAFGPDGGEPATLSPASAQLRTAAFMKSGELDAQTFKTYQKKLSGFLQSVNNAADRLVACQEEECVLLSCCWRAIRSLCKSISSFKAAYFFK